MAGRLSKSIVLTLLLLAGAPWLTSGLPAWGGETASPVPPRLLADTDYYPALLTAVQEAKQSIDLAMYLWRLTKSPKNQPRRLALALGQARRRGVKIRVVLEKSGYDQGINRANRETAQLLAQEGIKVIFDSPAVTTHVKLAVIDGQLTFLGSHNLTQSALRRNHELSLLVDDQKLAASLSAYFDQLTAP